MPTAAAGYFVPDGHERLLTFRVTVKIEKETFQPYAGL